MKPTTQNRLRELGALFSCAIFLVYSWTTYVFLWQLPSHLNRFNVAEIAGFLSYQYAYSLIESVLIALIASALVLVTPIKEARAQLAATGSAYLFTLAIGSYFYVKLTNVTFWMSKTFSLTPQKAFNLAVISWAVLFFGLLWLAPLLVKNERARHVIWNFLESLYALSGLYIALSVCALFVVIYRNLP